MKIVSIFFHGMSYVSERRKKFSLLSTFAPLFFTSCVLLPTFLLAQWLETTIYLPDSLSGVACPQSLACNATSNAIYGGGEGGECVVAIDGSTNVVITEGPIGHYPTVAAVGKKISFVNIS